MMRVPCSFKCCQRTFLPLELAFARTLHRFLGLSAGPVDPGKIENATTLIVCDPDIRGVEGKATGFFYTLISRATSFGDPNGLNSAIYFIGPNVTKERIQNLTLKSNTNTTLVNVQRRSAWVQHLEANTIDLSSITQRQMQETFAWARRPILSTSKMTNHT
jgi:hypothetical protein